VTGDPARPCAIVTGGSSGIGAATALALAERGFDVAITWAGGEERAAEVVERLEAAGARAGAWRLDLSDPAEAPGVVDSVLARLGRVDALVNCAGVNRRAELAEESLGEFQRVLAVNLAGPWAMAQAVAPHMIERGSGRIVNVTSVLAFAPLSGGGAYCASKSGLEALTRVLALELAPHGIHVNAVAPGHAATPMNYDEPFDVHGTPRPTIPMGRAADPAEIAAAIAFLASGEASYVNGASLLVDGGLLLASGPESMQRAAGLPAKR
jgi:NAD(P)-dependent dehydrogenase (short-subunit alcohol dehydrogenase family)